jgi:hypothetical protein
MKDEKEIQCQTATSRKRNKSHRKTNKHSFIIYQKLVFLSNGAKTGETFNQTF